MKLSLMSCHLLEDLRLSGIQMIECTYHPVEVLPREYFTNFDNVLNLIC